MTNRIVKYIDMFIDSSVCNLNCSYCYVRYLGKNTNTINPIPSKEILKKSFSNKRMGGSVLFNLCANGETFTHPQIIDIVEALCAEGHYISIVTNGTYTKAIERLIKNIGELNNFFFKFSFHYQELVKKNLLDVFIDNVHKVRDAGASFTIEIVASDDNVPYIDEIKRISMKEFGAFPHVTIPRDDRKQGIDLMTKYSVEEYKEIWGVFDSKLFDFKMEILYQKQTGYCMAGNISLSINSSSGDIMQCVGHPKIGNVYEDVDEPIPAKEVGHKCRLPYCYNGHVYLSLGDIKEYDAPTYLDVRNRITIDGSEWFTETMKNIFSQKICVECF